MQRANRRSQNVGAAGVFLGIVVPIVALGNFANAAAWGKAVALIGVYIVYVVFQDICVCLVVAPAWGVRQVSSKSFQERVALFKRAFVAKDWVDTYDLDGSSQILGAAVYSIKAAHDSEQAIGSSYEAPSNFADAACRSNAPSNCVDAACQCDDVVLGLTQDEVQICSSSDSHGGMLGFPFSL